MSAFSDYLENALLDHALGGAAFVQPTGVYLALYTSATADDGSGTEVVGGGYGRQAVTFAAAANGVKASDIAVAFSNLPAGTVTHIAYHDAATVGNMLYHGPLAAPITVGAGEGISFAAGQLTVAHD